MTMRLVMWSAVALGVILAVVGVAINQPFLIVVGAAIPFFLLPAAWIALIIMGVRWTLTGDKHGTLATNRSDDPRTQTEFVIRGTDNATGKPREVRIMATSTREVAASAAHLGITVTEIR